MSKWKLVLPAMILVGGLLVPATVSYGTPAIGKTTGAKCTVCHSKGKELNQVGECYKKSKDLKACEAK